MVTAKSGCVIMKVQGNDVLYYVKCNHCQHSEHDKPLRQTPFIKEGIVSLGDYNCPVCNKSCPVELRFHV